MLINNNLKGESSKQETDEWELESETEKDY
jgi:hypothetical protein